MITGDLNRFFFLFTSYHKKKSYNQRNYESTHCRSTYIT